MNRLRKFFRQLLFNDDFSFDEKLINFIFFIGFILSLFLMLTKLMAGANSAFVAALCGIAVLCGVFFYLCNKYRIFSQTKYAACFLVCDIIFPAGYFFFGGINSAMNVYFMLSTLIIFVLAYGKWFHVFIFTHVMIAIICYLIEFRYPHLVRQLDSYQIADGIHSLFIISLCIGFMVWFQTILYKHEKNEADAAEADNNWRATLLRAINNTARILLTADAESFEHAISVCLSMMGSAVHVDKIVVWKNSRRDGKLFYSKLYSWELYQHERFGTEFAYDFAVPEFNDKLFRGQHYAGAVSNFSGVMRDHLLVEGIKSTIAVPVFLRGEFWGFVSFDDCINTRDFSEDQIAILKSGALMIASAAAQTSAENELRASNKRIQTMLNASPICCSFWSEDFNCIDCNEAAAKLFGLQNKREYIEHYSELSPALQPDGKPAKETAAAYFREAAINGKTRFEWMHRKKDGTPLPVEIALLRVAGESSYNILSYTRDLSEYKQMMNAIEKRETLLNAINQAASILLKPHFEDFVSDLRTSMSLVARVVRADRMYVWKNFVKDEKLHTSQIYEWAGTVLPMQDTKFTTNLCYETDFPELYERLLSGQVINGSIQMLPQASRSFFSQQEIVSILIVPVFIQDEYWGFVGFDDCRIERSFEESEVSILRSASLLIAAAVLQNDMTQNLVKTREEALQSSKDKSVFLATMSHEIRTPLNAIIGLAEIQLQKNLPESAKADLEKIYSSGSTLLGIINEMLDISKIEAGGFELVPIEYDVPSLINDAVQLNIVRIGSKPIVFELSVDENLPASLHGDELRVKQVLNNVLSNAFKYTREGSVKLDAAWDDSALVFSVSDTGIGIKEADIGKLFGEYAQFDLIKNRKIEGTGLGLFITKKLLDAMGGTIIVKSEYGKGSCFTIRIPQKKVSENKIGRQVVDSLKNFNFLQERHARAQQLKRSYMPYGKVLIVDDVQTNLDVARGLMEPYGLTADCVLSGKEAVEAVRKEKVRYDAVFMDHMMPEMDGIEATRVIRNEIGTEYARTVPVIALTANALAGNEEMFLQNGFDAFVSKPIDILRLDAILNQFIRDKQSEQTLRDAERQAEELASLPPQQPSAESHWLLNISIDGIDIKAGVERYSGEKIFEGILDSYIRHTPGLLQKLSDLSFDKLKDYAIIAHGLKSASYGILANSIGKRAEELEALSKAGNYDEVLARNADFVRDAARLVENISSALGAAKNDEPQKETKDSIDAGLLKTIYESAKHFRTNELEDAVNKLEAVRYADRTHAELVSWLREQAEDLEYDAIRERLEEALL